MARILTTPRDRDLLYRTAGTRPLTDRAPDSRRRRALPRRRSHLVVSIDTSGTRLDEGAFIRRSRQPEEGLFGVNGRWVGPADLGRQLVEVQLAADPLVLRRMGEVRGSTSLKGGRRPGFVDNLLEVGALIVVELRIPTRRAYRLEPPPQFPTCAGSPAKRVEQGFRRLRS